MLRDSSHFSLLTGLAENLLSAAALARISVHDILEVPEGQARSCFRGTAVLQLSKSKDLQVALDKALCKLSGHVGSGSDAWEACSLKHSSLLPQTKGICLFSSTWPCVSGACKSNRGTSDCV